MYPFKQNIFRTSDDDSETPDTLLGFCVDWQAHNNGNIKMALQGSINFTQFLAGRTIAFLDGVVDQYRIDGVDVSCSIPLTHNATTVFWDEDSLPVVMDEVLTQIRIQISMVLSDATEIDTMFEWAALETPTQYDAEFNRCYLQVQSFYYRTLWPFDCVVGGGVHDPDINSWVEYIDGAGELQTQHGFCAGATSSAAVCMEVEASSIVDTNGVAPCTP